MEIKRNEPLAQGLKKAIQEGDLAALRKYLDEEPALARAVVVGSKGDRVTLLHLATDWPGHFPRVGETIRLLMERGADADVPMVGGNAPETPLHWAASSNDVAAIDALLDGGANLESPGAIFTNGTAMSDAVIFAQWNAARRLQERGAKTTFTEAAGLGLMDRVVALYAQGPEPESELLTAALWHACRGGQLGTVQFLVEKGANINWVGWDKIAPLDGAVQSGNTELMAWLLGQGARHARDLAGLQ